MDCTTVEGRDALKKRHSASFLAKACKSYARRSKSPHLHQKGLIRTPGLVLFISNSLVGFDYNMSVANYNSSRRRVIIRHSRQKTNPREFE